MVLFDFPFHVFNNTLDFRVVVIVTSSHVMEVNPSTSVQNIVTKVSVVTFLRGI